MLNGSEGSMKRIKAIDMDKLNVCDVLDSSFEFMMYQGAGRCQYVTLFSFSVVFLVQDFTEAAPSDRYTSKDMVGNSGDE